MFADRLSMDSLSSCSPEDATRNRERLVLSLIKGGPLLAYCGVVMRPEQQTAIEGAGQQNKLPVLDSKAGSNLNIKVEAGDDLESKVKTVDDVDVDVDVDLDVAVKLTILDSKGSNLIINVEAGNELKSKVKSVDDVDVNVDVNVDVDVDVDVDDNVNVESVTVKAQEEEGTGKKDWSTLKVSELKAELRVRSLKMSGRKADLVSRLKSSDLEIHSSENRIIAKPTSQLSSLELLELQKLEEHLHEIDECILNLKEYRGHLARHVSEDTYAQTKIDNLADDVAIVTSDYKMKILSCFFRETQKKWFGKRGTNLLGFMITTNSLVEADNKLRGVKDVQFVFMVTDDSLTDAWEVACAKATVYEEFLPDHVKKVRFWSDGAGCFKSKTHRVFQPFWKHWTGVEEIELRITPAGNGKSQLDGSFGRLNFVLHGAVDEGHSYFDAPSILNSISQSTGLAATKVRSFLPDRSSQVKGDIESIRFESVLLTLLDPNRDEKDNSVRAFHHSGYGQGQKLVLSMQSLIFYEDPDEADGGLSKTKKKEKKKAAMIEVYNVDVSQPEHQGVQYPSALCLTIYFFAGSIEGIH
jgi:hypothetical protein